MCCVDVAAGQVWTVELERAGAVCSFVAVGVDAQLLDRGNKCRSIDCFKVVLDILHSVLRQLLVGWLQQCEGGFFPEVVVLAACTLTTTSLMLVRCLRKWVSVLVLLASV